MAAGAVSRRCFEMLRPSDDTTADASAADVFDGLEHSASADQSGQA